VIEQEGEEEEEPPHETPSMKNKGKRKALYEEPDQDTHDTPSKKDKGKRKALYEEPDQNTHDTPSKKDSRRKALYEEPDQDTVEDEIAQELENIELGLEYISDDDEELPPQPVLKKAKAERKNPPTKVKTQSKTKKENQEPRQGVRRSQREHYRPLEYWRGERLVYGRTHNSGSILVPQIKEIIRIPKEIPVPFGVKRKRSTTRQRSHSRTLEAVEGAIPPALPVVNPEEGWDDQTEAKCTVIHFSTKEEVERRQ
jgi:centromere protein C